MIVLKRRWMESRDKPLPVILIIAEAKYNRTVDDIWFQFYWKIRAICTSAGQPEVNVEIGDPIAYIPIISSAVLSNNTIVQHWIVDVLSATGLDNVALEIGRGTVYSSHDIDNNFFDESDTSPKARFGGRLAGLHDSKRLGTFGGFIFLDFPDSKFKTCSLTCFHCVINDDTDGLAIKTWQTNGLQPNDPKNNIEISHPCRRDYEDIVARCREVITDLQPPEYYRLLALANDPEGLLSPQEQGVLDHGLILITAHKEKIRFADEFMRVGMNYFGALYAGSGLRLDEDRYTLDWALIDVSRQRVSGNKLPDGLLSNHFNPTVHRGDVTEAKFDMVSGQHVFKLGRSTGFTKGIVNGIETTRFRSCGLRGQSGDTLSQNCDIQWAIVPYNGKCLFSAQGDSLST
ncbi:hypothetical protein H112_02195 [Trichophyton rubrum D6]|uniref:Uncharacterized protein n=3 Tax=Trichophyton TaxID=5550 RepID=A0A178EYV1_TRIRU|nr:hypothetical protein H100_02194 [Trichophyton rubrum MR850]EZF44536.1 hypothetical protein H102_02191 [Trichophyton rubrum CBS 100081]EZF55193.1 hypothetical protein H103_02200 [Trichophyton rubrum CBS 288.86]EZF65808.1 hypothetical protein H104_02175 [Trichophyton rubrum CBS 289.86]EZF76451.1 hypothetical protein H105_02212 [Trichophyton soudanense CBS 452.61]EZF87126.1 hypothetical protein H110_02196 [Trichophyton rubrum MR1448]EZF97863.1 hypothetical protein H113_02201 [Trichophyton rub